MLAVSSPANCELKLNNYFHFLTVRITLSEMNRASWETKLEAAIVVFNTL